MLIAQISDLHLDGTDRATDRATRVLDHLRALPVDVLLVTGDVADHGTEAEYRQAAQLLTLPFPVFTLPGNHDVRGPFRATLLGGPPDDTPVNAAHTVAGLAILLCDSTIPGQAGGELAPSTLDWIDRTLRALPSGTPALMCCHHPPAPVHHPWIDTMALANPGALATVLDAHPEVVALLTGHTHTATASTFAGRPWLGAPGVVSMLRMPWQGEDPIDLDAPPGIAFHLLDDQHRVTTHFRTVG